MITIRTISEADIDLILNDKGMEINDLIFMSASTISDKETFMNYINDPQWHVFSLEIRDVFFGIFGIRNRNGIQLSRAYILSRFRGARFEGKLLCQHLAEIAIAKGRELFSSETRVWCIVYSKIVKGRLFVNKGRQCWELAGFNQVSETEYTFPNVKVFKTIMEL